MEMEHYPFSISILNVTNDKCLKIKQNMLQEYRCTTHNNYHRSNKKYNCSIKTL